MYKKNASCTFNINNYANKYLNNIMRMLVINLKRNSHKVVEEEIESSSNNSIYSSNYKLGAKNKSLETVVRELTDEEKKYLKLYNKHHDKYFNSDSSTKVKVYVYNKKESIFKRFINWIKKIFKKG